MNKPTEAQELKDDFVPCPMCGEGAVLRNTRPSDSGGEKLLNALYAVAYHAGHHDTVESQYVDVAPADYESYHEDAVREFLADHPVPDSGDEKGLLQGFANWIAGNTKGLGPAWAESAVMRVKRGEKYENVKVEDMSLDEFTIRFGKQAAGFLDYLAERIRWHESILEDLGFEREPTPSPINSE